MHPDPDSLSSECQPGPDPGPRFTSKVRVPSSLAKDALDLRTKQVTVTPILTFTVTPILAFTFTPILASSQLTQP